MEHRWGQRAAFDLAAEVRALKHETATAARILNMSVSGALIRTALDVEAFTGIEVLVNRHWLLAWVTRREGSVLAVEWMEMAPEAVVRELEVAALGLTFRGGASTMGHTLNR